MANPQKENGHIDIANEIAEHLAKTDLSASESKILWVIWRKTWGWHKKKDVITLKQFKEATELLKPHIARTIRRLCLREIITKNGNVYGFQKDYDRWKAPIKEIITKNGNVYFITKNGNAFTKIGNRITKIGNNEWLKLKSDKEKRAPKETISKETITKENNTTVQSKKNIPYLKKKEEEKINFNFDKGEWENITLKDIAGWEEAYPACDVKVELAQMREWCIANPKKAKKKNYRRFITNWLSRSQERGGTKKKKKSFIDMELERIQREKEVNLEKKFTRGDWELLRQAKMDLERFANEDKIYKWLCRLPPEMHSQIALHLRRIYPKDNSGNYNRAKRRYDEERR